MTWRSALAAVGRQLLIVIAVGLVALAVAFTLLVWLASEPTAAADPDHRCDACQPAGKASPRPEPTVIGLPAPEPSPAAPRDVPVRTLPPTDTAPRRVRPRSAGAGYRPAVRPSAAPWWRRLQCALTDHDRVTIGAETFCVRCKRTLWIDRDRWPS